LLARYRISGLFIWTVATNKSAIQVLVSFEGVRIFCEDGISGEVLDPFRMERTAECAYSPLEERVFFLQDMPFFASHGGFCGIAFFPARGGSFCLYSFRLLGLGAS